MAVSLCLSLGCSSGGSSGGGAAGAGGGGGNGGGGGSSGTGGTGGAAGASGSAGAAGSGGSSGAAGCDPAAPDTVGDDVDQNCDGVDGVDGDGDGVASSGSGGTDCDDGEASVFPGASETWLFELVAIDYAKLCGGSFSGCQTLPTPSDLVVDAAGQFHLPVRATGFPFDLVYVANTGGTWWSEVASTHDGESLQLAVGPAGERHLAFYVDNFATRIYIASSSSVSGGWSSQTIGNLNDFKINPRIATDAAGVVHVLGTDENKSASGGGISPNDLYYATSQDGFGVSEVGLPGTEKLSGLSFVVSVSGTPHAAWHDAGTTTVSGPADPRMRYANPSVGIAETIDEDGSGGITSIALDATDEPVISYWKTSGSGVALTVARRASGTWSTETVLQASGAYLVQLAYGASTTHLCSVDSGTLAYLSRADAGAGWATEALTTSAGQTCHIVYDAVSAKPHVAFAMNKRIFKASPSPSPGVDRDCDGGDD